MAELGLYRGSTSSGIQIFTTLFVSSSVLAARLLGEPSLDQRQEEVRAEPLAPVRRAAADVVERAAEADAEG
jgi:hypothetical protein